MKHTKEPWRTDIISNTIIFDKNKEFDLEVSVSIPREKFGGLARAQADGCRIVACVNACAGIGTDMLNDTGPLIDIITMQKDRANKLTAQNAELLAALKKIEILEHPTNHQLTVESIHHLARAAIAKMEADK